LIALRHQIRLSRPIAAARLKTNLRPETRHEVLNIDIKSVPDLREICSRREAFSADIVVRAHFEKIVKKWLRIKTFSYNFKSVV